MTAATPPTRFLPRCSGIAALGLMAVLCVAPAGATTLDPSHPVWDGPHAGAWSRALVQFGHDPATFGAISSELRADRSSEVAHAA